MSEFWYHGYPGQQVFLPSYFVSSKSTFKGGFYLTQNIHTALDYCGFDIPRYVGKFNLNLSKALNFIEYRRLSQQELFHYLKINENGSPTSQQVYDCLEDNHDILVREKVSAVLYGYDQPEVSVTDTSIAKMVELIEEWPDFSYIMDNVNYPVPLPQGVPVTVMHPKGKDLYMKYADKLNISL
jgi:hypothetical protein